MAVEADAVVVELQAKVDGYNAAIAGAATKTEAALGKIGQAATNIEKNTARAQNATRNLGRQIGDIGTGLATGQNPFFIIAQQSAQVADALADTGGRAAKVAAFFAGPWGAALLAAGSALGILLGKALAAGEGVDDLVDKLRKNATQAELAERANAIFAGTLEGVEEAAREADKAIKALNGQNETSAQKALQAADAALKQTAAIRTQIEATIELIEAQAEAQKRNGQIGSQRGEVSSLGDAGLGSVLTSQRERLARLDQTIQRLQNSRNVFQSFVEVERGIRDAAQVANDKYDLQIANQRKLREQGKLTAAGLKHEIDLIQAARKAELQRISDVESARKKTSSQREIGNNSFSTADASALVRGLGGTVTSTTRSTAKQAQLYSSYLAGTGPLAAKPGSSFHEKGQAIDVAKSAGVTLNGLVKAFRDKGVQVVEALDEGRHYHIAWATGAKKLARETERAATEAQRNADRYADEISTLDAKIAGLKDQQGKSLEQQVAAANAAVEREQANRDAGFARQARDGQINDAQLKELTARSATVAGLEKIAIATDARAKRLQQEDANAGALLDLNSARLRYEQQTTDSSKRKHELDIQLINLRYDELIAQQKRIVELNANADDVARARQKIEQLGIERQTDIAASNQSARGPLEQYFATFGKDPQTQIEQAVVDKLEAVDQAIADAAANTLGVKDPFLKSLLKIFLEQNVLKPLYDAFSKTGSGGGGIGGFFASLFGAVTGGSGGAPTASNSVFGQPGHDGGIPTFPTGFGRASGGNVRAGQPYIVGEHRQELFVPSQSGKIIPRVDAPGAGGGNTIVQQTFVLDARGGVTTPQLLQYVNDTAARAATKAGQTAYDASPQRSAKLQSYGT